MATLATTLRETMKDFIFGSEDGLISNLGLVLGVAASGAANETVLLAGLASMFVGAVSMAAGDYLSTKSQREVIEEEILEEEKRLSKPGAESKAVKELYRAAKFTDREIKNFVSRLNTNKALSLKILAEERLGIIPEKYENPVKGATTLFLAYVFGALFPILPFMFENTRMASMFSLLASAAVLFAVGAAKTRITKRDWLKSGLEMLCVALAAATVGFLIGRFFGTGVL